jgi:uncharacterized iron-regulated membrane protein
MKIRPFWVLLHRYVGLTMTVFLIIVGFTGSLLAFYAELENSLNPQLSVPSESREPLDFAVLLDNAQRAAPEAVPESVWLSPNAARVSVYPQYGSTAKQAKVLDYNQLILNPYTGEALGRRHWGAISQGLGELMPFIYQLHYSLALGSTGIWILGITALVWSLDCFVGFYLTLPASRRNQADYPKRSFWQRWRVAWQVKFTASTYRVNFDLHRAGGLWLWLALLIFAWSSVAMNLTDSVYSKVTQTVFELHQPWSDIADLPEPLVNPAINWREAERLGREALAQAAMIQGFSIEAPVSMWLNRKKGFYVYMVRSSLDFQDKSGQTRVVIDANSGEQKMLLLPQGQYSGNTLTAWLMALHMANVFGLPYRIFVCLLGLAIVMLAVTGVVIWLKKRRVRVGRKI